MKKHEIEKVLNDYRTMSAELSKKFLKSAEEMSDHLRLIQKSYALIGLLSGRTEAMFIRYYLLGESWNTAAQEIRPHGKRVNKKYFWDVHDRALSALEKYTEWNHFFNT